MTQIGIPQLCLVALVGASGSGKSTFAAEHFGRFEVVSSDFCRGLVADDENDQSASKDAFDVLGYITGKRLAAGRLTVVDATNVTKEARRQLVELAKAHDVLPVAIVLDVPASVASERNRSRADRDFGPHVVKRHTDQLRRSLKSLGREGFRKVHVLSGVEAIETAEVVREKLLNDHRDQHGPFDVIGDVHGCRAELESLLKTLGYLIERDERGRSVDAGHPAGRTVVFVGDLVDRGPDSPGVLRLAMGMTASGHALAVPGNHEHKLVRALDGRNVQVTHGLETTLDQLTQEGQEFRDAVREWCYGLVSHLVLDDGRLVVAHAGLKEAYHGRASGRVRSFALYGDTTGETDEFGLPVRYPWAGDYRGRAMVLYGHTPTPVPEWVNNTLCLDTGAVFGGHLTALRYPEKQIVQVAAESVWYEPAKPFPTAGQTADGPAGTVVSGRGEDELDLTDVLGKRVVETAHHGRVSIRAEHAAGALEVMSRFALHPRWLPYLPPTMSPVATSARDGLLEHPDEAFAYFADVDVPRVVCEEKHMGSRAVLLVCRDADTAARRFGATSGETGAVYTRTGRSFLGRELTEELLQKVRAGIESASLWGDLDTDWVLLDAELLPWSLKAEPLLREQYAAVGAAARASLPVAVSALEAARSRGLDVGDLLTRTQERVVNAEAFTAAYRPYVWSVDGLDGVQVAPFQVLASEGRTWHDHDHLWHLEAIDRLVAADPVTFRPTRRVVVDLAAHGSRVEATRWWEELTASGGEGMVVKPLGNLTRTPKGLVQPGLKVRGREYLRIIYGPDYTTPANLSRLKSRTLGHKRSLALREYALGLESLERTARGEPLWRVHEPVFAVLAMESEPVDPRL
ncbi:polynucleotide kinase-phosphatase [Humibacillus sp. DSM 29435]|uniref:polynucleotide kinase-phosphatase n=1 Tax=Humibacillus sp. DSM 29435 TaxID=1869167 RepID=UPI00087202EC|nr:polynucleotide kinase-phosphatase [Humibacillus sp. DSM 29435]OFE15646.1 polynucleotide kinase-phosphatase [Humibacillus sp. DSM 29435]